MTGVPEYMTWSELRDAIRARMEEPERARWDRERKKARDRYRSEIRRYRGIDRIRRLYRRKRRGGW